VLGAVTAISLQASGQRMAKGSGNRALLLINLLTGSRLVFALGVALLIPWSKSETWAVLVSTGLVVTMELSDLLDGYLARRNNAVSLFGKLFDPFSDSVSRLTVYWSLAWVQRCLSVVPLVMAIRDVAVSYTRILAMRRGDDVAAKWAGKAKAVVQGACAVALMSGPLYWGEWGPTIIGSLSALVLGATLASLVYYGREALLPARGAS